MLAILTCAACAGRTVAPFDGAPAANVCGDGVAADAEDCDGADLRGHTCRGLGLAGGTLRCSSSCALESSCTPPLIVEDISLHLQDVSMDGQQLAFTDLFSRLYTVPVGGGAPVSTDLDTDVAKYVGRSLIAFHGVDGENIAASANQFADGDATPTALPAGVRVSSFKASPDGGHLAFEVKQGGDEEDLVLDGVVIIAGLRKNKVRFSPSSDFLVVGANIPSGIGTLKTVRSYPLNGGEVGEPRVIAADGAANETQVTHDGTRVIFGANEGHDGNVVDISVAPIEGGAATVVRAQGDDAAFKLTVDDHDLISLTDTTAPGGGAVEKHALDGSGSAFTIVPAGAVDLAAVSSTHLVYATSVLATAPEKVRDLRVVRLDGGGDTQLGQNATVVGFTPDERFFVVRADVAGLSELRAFDAESGVVSTLASGVVDAAIASSTSVVYRDAGGLLVEIDPATGKAIALDSRVGAFRVVRSGPGADADLVAYSTGDPLDVSSTNDGIHVRVLGFGCGDGVLEPLLGEACDDDNVTSGDGCNVDCQP